IQELEESHNEVIKIRKKSRNLYFSETRMRQKRSYELQKQQFVDKLCSIERKFVSTRKAKPVMFTGDRGLGIGSQCNFSRCQWSFVLAKTKCSTLLEGKIPRVEQLLNNKNFEHTREDGVSPKSLYF
ncbi:hypothetical protein K501DRAFT_276604, partial [Backusella circina FSU 941]